VSRKKNNNKAEHLSDKRNKLGLHTKSDMTSRANAPDTHPYVTEGVQSLNEKENKLAFIVTEKATKKPDRDAINILYEKYR